MLHLQSEQNCVTEMEKQEEGAPFLSLAAGGAPRFIQMLLTQPKPKVMVSFTRRHLRTQNTLYSQVHLTSLGQNVPEPETVYYSLQVHFIVISSDLMLARTAQDIYYFIFLQYDRLMEVVLCVTSISLCTL